MKKLLILLVSIPLLLSSCLKEEKNIFDADSATRIDKVQKEVNLVLKEAKNGWLMEYYPSSLKQYGGYTMYVRFKDDNKVDFASEIAANSAFTPDLVEESLYSFGADTGPTLNFDTYNKIFHSWSDPAPDGKGLQGDYEFIILDYSKDMIKLKGKKTGNYCILTPLALDKTWEVAMTEYNASAELMDDAPVYAVVTPEEATPNTIAKSNRTFKVNIKRGDKIDQTSASYIYTPTGLKFYSPFEVLDGVFIQSLTYNPTTEIFADDAGSGITIVKVKPPLNEIITLGNYYFKYSGLSTWAKAKWDITKGGVAGEGEELYRVWLGTSQSPYSLCFHSHPIGTTSLYGGTHGYNAVPVAGTKDQITMQCTLTATGDGVWYVTNAKFASLLEIVGYKDAADKAETRKYTLTSDNPNNPTWIKFTEMSATTGTANENYFTVYKAEVILPSEN